MTRDVEARRDAFGVEPICRELGVPVSTHYARRSRKPSARALADEKLVAEIYAARVGYRRAYGVRKTWKELKRREVAVGRDHVARLMRQEGLEGFRSGKKRRTTIPDEAAVERARDLLQRDFSATRPNEKWVADITYIRTWSGFVYLAFILDCYSRMIVGWQLDSHLCTDLVLDALEMANGLRRPDDYLIAHTDCGSQYTSLAYTDRLDELGAAPSVGSKGDAYDSAMAEAWVATFKTELVDGRRFPSYEHLEHETLHWISFYNDDRLHEELADVPSSEYEQMNYKTDNIKDLSTDNRASNKPRVLQGSFRHASRCDVVLLVGRCREGCTSRKPGHTCPVGLGDDPEAARAGPRWGCSVLSPAVCSRQESVTRRLTELVSGVPDLLWVAPSRARSAPQVLHKRGSEAEPEFPSPIGEAACSGAPGWILTRAAAPQPRGEHDAGQRGRCRTRPGSPWNGRPRGRE